MTINADDLRRLVRALVIEVLSELADSSDPDVGLEFTPEVAAYLQTYRAEQPEGMPVEDVIRELGLDV